MKSDKSLYLELFLLVLFSFAACFASGYGFGYGSAGKDVLIGTAGTTAFLLVCAFISPRFASRCLLFFAVCMVLYFPTGWLYGAPTFKLVGSLLETDKNEAGNFLSSIPTYVFILQTLFLLGAILVWKQSRLLFEGAKHWHRKIKIYITVLLVILLVFPLGKVVLGSSFQDDNTSSIPVTIVGFYADSIAAPYIYFEKKREIDEQAAKPSSWHIESVTPKYKNYVLIIGESARSDYMHIYGYPIENTPFFNKVNGTFINGYISIGEMTMLSVPNSLSLRRSGRQEINNSVITLARKAGFSTHWLTNQGEFGFFTRNISIIARQSEFDYFTYHGEYNNAVALSDTLLLPELNKALNKPETRPRFIVMHIIGSHADFCRRLDNPAEFKPQLQSKPLSCYVETIRQTDSFLEKVVSILKESSESYSLVYFSDHGLKHIDSGANRTLTHGGDTYETFAVPLAKISSDDTEHRVIKTQRSMFNFLKGFSQWTGIKAQEIPIEEGYDFFGEKPDLLGNGNNLSQINSLPHDPAVTQ